MWCAHEGMGWWMLFGGVFMFLFWVALVALVVWGITRLARRGDSGPGAIERRNPLEIAKERYARGEISREEFEQIKKDLS